MVLGWIGDSSGKNYTLKKVYEKGKRGDITGSAR